MTRRDRSSADPVPVRRLAFLGRLERQLHRDWSDAQLVTPGVPGLSSCSSGLTRP